MDERGQGTVEWVGLVCVVALLLVALVFAGVRVPGAGLARALGEKLLCAVAMVERCGDEGLVLAYGDEVAELVREHAPTLRLERGSKALPVDFRRCRETACADGSARGLVDESDAGLPVTAFVRVLDCRRREARECAGPRAGNLYLSYWFYYADSATLRGVPVAGARGFHLDDWESVQFRIGADGAVAQRASSHHGYNHARSIANAGSDAGLTAVRRAAEALGMRPRNGWGPATGQLFVSGGSHAGNVDGNPGRSDRTVPAGRLRLIPLEPLATSGEADRHRFAVTPPWRKRVWRDPEAQTTN